MTRFISGPADVYYGGTWIGRVGETPMTEQEWLTSTDPAAMLNFLCNDWAGGTNWANPSPRKLRLFCCACCSLDNQKVDPHWEDEGPWEKSCNTDAAHWARHWSIVRAGHKPPKEIRAALLRDIFGNPYRPVRIERQSDGRMYRLESVEESWEPWRKNKRTGDRKEVWTPAPWAESPNVLAIAQAAYGGEPCPKCKGKGQLLGYLADPQVHRQCEACAGSGRTPFDADLRVLGDALEEAGVQGGILTHLREPGHVRGCWVLDLLLGKL